MRRMLVVMGVVLVDQAVKVIFFPDDALINSGVAFGLGRSWLPSWLGIFLTASLVVWVIRQADGYIGWDLVAGGGLANLVDRLVRGGVVDFIRPIGSFAWFNLADIAITIGVLCLSLKLLRKRMSF